MTLRSALAHEDVVVFVGSGVSAWSGLPSWKRLLEQLATFLDDRDRDGTSVRGAIAAGDLLLAASYGFDQLDSTERRQYLIDAIGDKSAKPSKLHEAIVALGAKNYITTNYDTLLERAITEYASELQPDVVTPANVLEIPSIVQTRSDAFVFKPHGDIGNIDTVVLTREDYRAFQSERANVFEAVQTLLSSRPVVFIGFGLRDPDFTLIRDSLYSTYKSHPANHVAILPDVGITEKAYWRRHHGLDLVSYETTSGPNPHASLLSLIEEVAHDAGSAVSATSLQRATGEPEGDDDAVAMRLVRFSRGVRHRLGERSVQNYSLSLTINRDRTTLAPETIRRLRVDGEHGLAEIRGHFAIEGPSGAGKSHLIRNLIRSIAEDLETHSINGLHASSRIPVLFEMRDYDGNLRQSIERLLPFGIPYDKFVSKPTAVVILDGLNEAPTDLAEQLKSDIASLLTEASMSTVLITTRFAGSLDGLDVEWLTIDSVPSREIERRLAERGLSKSDVNAAVMSLLRRPLYFTAWLGGSFSLTEGMSVRAIYDAVIRGHQDKLQQSAGQDLLPQLKAIAYNAVDGGALTVSSEVALWQLGKSGVEGGRALSIILDEGFLVATPSRQLAFYHHSIAEYLASDNLATMLAARKRSIEDVLGRRDWDQALMLALEVMGEAQGSLVWRRILQVDTVMAIRALNYVDAEIRDPWARMALDYVATMDRGFEEDFRVAQELSNLGVDRRYESALERLAAGDGPVAGVAMSKLASIYGHVTAGMVARIVSRNADYNFASNFVRAAGSLADLDVGLAVLERLDGITLEPSEEEALEAAEEVNGLASVISHAGALLGFIDSKDVFPAFPPGSALTRRALNDMAHDRGDHYSRDFVLKEVRAGYRPAIVALYFQLHFCEDYEPVHPDTSLEDVLVAHALQRGKISRWAMGCLQKFAEHFDDFRIDIERLQRRGGIGTSLLLYVNGDAGGFEREMSRLLEDGFIWDDYLGGSLSIVDSLSPTLASRLLTADSSSLVLGTFDALRSETGEVDNSFDDIGAVGLMELLVSLEKVERFSSFNAGRVIARRASPKLVGELVALFNIDESSRRVVSLVLQHVDRLSGADFDPDSVDWLIEHGHLRHMPLESPLLAKIADEQMVESRLIPAYQLEASGSTRRAYLRSVLEACGQRLKRRFVGADGCVLGVE
ncbi:SIR2 family NAD-dependent protein deacylase [Curtobacterium flaccumfaciens]|uniref:SIR2 family NAD-dependent protein deacylase n=1 Tax=Curtobacterium flaccumfaciens TaxID=2035 RepID=UPI00220CAEF8|nr:SIR2 family protein [Curtobacterium flaccumfaciens]UWD80045.1 SIR2 family protein [Curtobacterium flaccumfaciens]